MGRVVNRLDQHKSIPDPLSKWIRTINGSKDQIFNPNLSNRHGSRSDQNQNLVD